MRGQETHSFPSSLGEECQWFGRKLRTEPEENKGGKQGNRWKTRKTVHPNVPREMKSNRYIQRSTETSLRQQGEQARKQMGDEETKSIFCPEARRKKSNNRDEQKGNGDRRTALATWTRRVRKGYKWETRECPGISIVPKHLEVLKPRHTWGTRRIVGPKKHPERTTVVNEETGEEGTGKGKRNK